MSQSSAQTRFNSPGISIGVLNVSAQTLLGAHCLPVWCQLKARVFELRREVTSNAAIDEFAIDKVPDPHSPHRNSSCSRNCSPARPKHRERAHMPVLTMMETFSSR